MEQQNSFTTNSYYPDGSYRANKHAIVIGGSIAGLTTARILTDYFEQVTILERDHFPEGVENRKGVPQGRHPHIILKRGEIILEQLFPGLVEELVAAGAVIFNGGLQSKWFTYGRWRPSFESKINLTGCSRPLLETTVRRRLMSHPRIRFVQDCEVIGLQANEAGTHVAGVRIRSRNGTRLDNQAEIMRTELVVDASGRDSKAPEWLAELGYTPPAETVINGNPGYATRVFQRPADWQEDWKLLYVPPKAPYQKRGIIFLPLEGGECWNVTVIGMAGDHPPIDEEGYMEFAHSLPTLKPYEVLQQFKPITPVIGYRRADNRMRHYEKMPRYLENFLVTGDAAVAFNPVYGQGMSVAALEALELNDCLAQYSQVTHTEGLAAYFQMRLVKAVALPWQMATNEDRHWTEGEKNQVDQEAMLMGRYMEQVMRATTANPNVLEVFNHVMHLLEAPSIFFRPDIVLQVVNEIVATR